MDDKHPVLLDTSHDIPVIHLSGEITSFSDENINRAFTSAMAENSSKTILDFSSVKYINSAGIAILVNLVTETKKRQGKLYFAGLAMHYKRVMEIVGITEYVNLFDSVGDAMERARAK